MGSLPHHGGSVEARSKRSIYLDWTPALSPAVAIARPLQREIAGERAFPPWRSRAHQPDKQVLRTCGEGLRRRCCPDRTCDRFSLTFL